MLVYANPKAFHTLSYPARPAGTGQVIFRSFSSRNSYPIRFQSYTNNQSLAAENNPESGTGEFVLIGPTGSSAGQVTMTSRGRPARTTSSSRKGLSREKMSAM